MVVGLLVAEQLLGLSHLRLRWLLRERGRDPHTRLAQLRAAQRHGALERVHVVTQLVLGLNFLLQELDALAGLVEAVLFLQLQLLLHVGQVADRLRVLLLDLRERLRKRLLSLDEHLLLRVQVLELHVRLIYLRVALVQLCRERLLLLDQLVVFQELLLQRVGLRLDLRLNLFQLGVQRRIVLLELCQALLLLGGLVLLLREQYVRLLQLLLLLL